jgi:hypothetical protein
LPHLYDRSASFIRGRYGTEYISVLHLIVATGGSTISQRADSETQWAFGCFPFGLSVNLHDKGLQHDKVGDMSSRQRPSELP